MEVIWFGKSFDNESFFICPHGNKQSATRLTDSSSEYTTNNFLAECKCDDKYRTFALCTPSHAPESVERIVNIMTGCDNDDQENKQDEKQDFHCVLEARRCCRFVDDAKELDMLQKRYDIEPGNILLIFQVLQIQGIKHQDDIRLFDKIEDPKSYLPRRYDQEKCYAFEECQANTTHDGSMVYYYAKCECCKRQFHEWISGD